MTSTSADPNEEETQPFVGGGGSGDVDDDSNDGSGEITIRREEIMRSLRRQSVGRISVTGINFQIPTNIGAQDHVQSKHGDDSWRLKVLQFLHLPKVQMTMMILLVLDIIILFTEIFLFAEFPPCSRTLQNCYSCCPPLPGGGEGGGGRRATNDESDIIRLLSGEDEPICEEPLQQSGVGGCDSSKYSTVHTIEEVLFALTIVILTTFFIELNMEMIALRPHVFFRQFFFALDYFIVTVSITLELIFHFFTDEALQAYGGSLIIFRMWRFVRIGHGIIEITAEWTHHQYAELLEYTEELEEMVKDQGLTLPEKAAKIFRGAHSSDGSTSGSGASSGNPSAHSSPNVGELSSDTKFYASGRGHLFH